MSGHNVKGKSKLSRFDEGHGRWTTESSGGGSWPVKSPSLANYCLTQLLTAITYPRRPPNLCHPRVPNRIDRRQSSDGVRTHCVQTNTGSEGWLDPRPLGPFARSTGLFSTERGSSEALTTGPPGRRAGDLAGRSGCVDLGPSTPLLRARKRSHCGPRTGCAPTASQPRRLESAGYVRSLARGSKTLQLKDGHGFLP